MKRTPLTRGGPLKRTTALRKRGRKGSRFPHRRDPAYCAWIRTHDCLIGRDCAGRVECAHVKTRGAGGMDVANTVPLCTRHHREQHSHGIRTFERKYRVDLVTVALVFGTRQPAEIGAKRLRRDDT